MPFKKTEAVLIEATTGCTCCSNENHYRGPYRDNAAAERRILAWKTGNWWPLASKYASRGCYHKVPVVIEDLGDGRSIVSSDSFEDRVVQNFDIIEVDDDGKIGESFAREELWNAGY